MNYIFFFSSRKRKHACFTILKSDCRFSQNSLCGFIFKPKFKTFIITIYYINPKKYCNIKSTTPSKQNAEQAPRILVTASRLTSEPLSLAHLDKDAHMYSVSFEYPHAPTAI